MNSVDSRSPFFPGAKTTRSNIEQLKANQLARNTDERVIELRKQTEDHAKVNIPEAIKDFSRIKKAVDTMPAQDNSEKIAALKNKIANGTYEIDYEKLADKMLESEY